MKRSPVSLFMILLVICLCLFTGCDDVAQTNTPEYLFTSSDLEKYTIIYPIDNFDYYDFAIQLADQILENYGLVLNVLPDAISPVSQYEILFGNTNRELHQDRIMEYSVTVSDGKVQINVGGSFSAEKAVAYLCRTVFNGQEFSLSSGTHAQKILMTQRCPVTEGAGARIMTANILADAFADSSYKNANYRAEIFAGMLIAYTPDILGLQESDESWDDVLDSYLVTIRDSYGIAYTRLLSSYEGKTNYTSLLYRSDKFNVDDSGLTAFSWWVDPLFNHSYHMRNITWAKFSSLENPSEEFVVANTHWSYRTEHANGTTYLAEASSPIATNELRNQCRQETYAILESLRQEYAEIPLLLVGDFNTSLSFFTQSGWTPPSFSIISEEAKNNGTALVSVPDSGHYDHLFGTGNYTIGRYEYVKNVNSSELLTDHPFAYADLFF